MTAAPAKPLSTSGLHRPTSTGRSPRVLRHFLSLADLTPSDFARLLSSAAAIKREPHGSRDAMCGRSGILLFEKDSLRTRCSFEVGIHRLGGHAMYMDHSKQRIGVRESLADYARNLDRYFALIVARVYEHATVAGLAEHSAVPVINALCDRHHPCQALADFLTIAERLHRFAPRPTPGTPPERIDAGSLGDLRRVKLAYIGEPNNVSNSLLHAAALSGATMTLVAPPGCGFDEVIWQEAASIAEGTGAALDRSDDPAAVRGHNVIYTDTWFSMGYSEAEESREARLKRFAPYQVNADLMASAGPKAIFMHCLPASRGVEVTDEVMDSAQSVVFDQAENRLWAQMALMAELMGCG